MKRLAILLFGLGLWLPGSAQWYDDFHDGYYDEYFGDGLDDVYRFGFMIDNYAASYTDRFVIEMAREYGVSRSDLRYYIRKGYAPSDLLFGLELARRSGHKLKHVMDRYYRSRDRDWVSISIALGIGRGSTGFRLILDCFRHQYRYWNDYYVRRNPHRVHPPVYPHAWSYFRPRVHHGAPHPVQSRPSVPPRPERPAPPQRPAVPSRPRPDGYAVPRPGTPSRSERPSRPSAPDRPQHGQHGQKSAPQGRPSPSQKPSRPENGPAYGKPSSGEKKNAGYRRDAKSESKASPAPQGKSSGNKGYRR